MTKNRIFNSVKISLVIVFILSGSNVHADQFRVHNQGVLPGPIGNHRTHIKMIQVDSKSVIAGGRNLSDDYFGLSKNINSLIEI